jgi:nucleoid-associated protein YgaU
MAVSASSRYAGSKIQPVTDAAGVTRNTILPAAPADTTYQVSFYAWRGSDRMDLLAARFYGDERLWWLIAKANPEVVDWFSIAPGTVLRIPNAQQ